MAAIWQQISGNLPAAASFSKHCTIIRDFGAERLVLAGDKNDAGTSQPDLLPVTLENTEQIDDIIISNHLC